MSKFKNPNKRTADDKEKQRASGGEGMKKHGTAKERLLRRNRLRALRKKYAKPIQEYGREPTEGP